MDIVAPLVANPKATVLMEPTQGPFHHPAVDSQSAPVFSAAFRQHRADVALTKEMPWCGAVYAYDALGRRTWRSGPAGDWNPPNMHFYYAGAQCVEERASIGYDRLVRQYVWGRYVDELIQQRTSVPLSATYYPLSDLLYRSVALVDADKAIVEAYDTDAYGRTRVYVAGGGVPPQWFTDNDVLLPSNEPRCRYLFTGREFEWVQNLYFYRARYYQPTLGRWVSRDPIGYEAGLNLYEYTSSDPLSSLDPLGLIVVSVSGKSEWTFVIGSTVGDWLTSLAGTNWVEAVLKGEADDCCKWTKKPEASPTEGTRVGWSIASTHVSGPEALDSNRKCPKGGGPVLCSIYQIAIYWEAQYIPGTQAIRLIKDKGWVQSIVQLAICSDGHTDVNIIHGASHPGWWKHTETKG